MPGVSEGELERTRRERDTARRVAEEALRHLTDDQLAEVRDTLDAASRRDEPEASERSS